MNKSAFKKGYSAKRGRGQPPFEPSKDQRTLVKLMAGFGIPHDRMRLGITNPYTKKPISRDVLERAFARELEIGTIEMDIAAMKSITAQIKKGNVTMLIWYSKNRWGWRDSYDATLRGGAGGVEEASNGQRGMVITIRGGLPDPPEFANPGPEASGISGGDSVPNEPSSHAHSDVTP
jgi:hypothetical protein